MCFRLKIRTDFLRIHRICPDLLLSRQAGCLASPKHLKNWIARMILIAMALGFPVHAAATAQQDIRKALENWRDDFNARRATAICKLFSQQLRYDFRGLPEQNYDQLCQRLQHALINDSPSIHYDLKIKEILVSGELAVVRLVWTSRLTQADGNIMTHQEPGLDVFARQRSGEWKIIRYIAYEND